MHPPLIRDSAIQLDAQARAQVAVCGSHGGLYPAWLAARAGVRAVVFNDAGIGRSASGVGGVYWLGGLGIAACAVDFQSARIADGADTMANGVLSTVNDAAAALGCRPGQPVREAVAHLAHAHAPQVLTIPDIGETRVSIPNVGHRPAWALDSVALLEPRDARAIVVSGSHGGLPGGEPDAILAIDVFAAFFNDAGGGKDGAGFARLPTLDPRGIAAATVWSGSARIGDGRSTYEDGVLSRVNETAARLGVTEGMTAREAVARLLGLG
ncbi:MAG: hypothetical protein IPP91_12695 [Betaproteobacteria bacterium]|nr:hypothetical protein [Betaproteobacteria bacterium]